MAAWRTKQLKREIGAPALAEPSWYHLVGFDLRSQDDRAESDMSPEARRIMERKRRKQTRKANEANAQRRHAQRVRELTALLMPRAA